MSAPTITEEPTEVLQDESENPRYSHYVRKDQIVDSMVSNVPLLTLCNRLLVPSRDHKKFPACPVCVEVIESMRG